eukprot:279282_1
MFRKCFISLERSIASASTHSRFCTQHARKFATTRVKTRKQRAVSSSKSARKAVQTNRSESKPIYGTATTSPKGETSLESPTDKSLSAESAPTASGTLQENLLLTDSICISRQLEMMNILIGFEQANKYVMKNKNGEIVGHIMEEQSLGKTVLRNVMHKHRPFKATILDTSGNVVFKLSRPMYLISSSMEIRDGKDQLIGEMKMNWHVWRRRYDLFLHQKQFARVDTGFMGWEFEVKNDDGQKMAVIDRNFEGWGKLLLADAGLYAIHFENSTGTPDGSSSGSAEPNPSIAAGSTSNASPAGKTSAVTPPSPPAGSSFMDGRRDGEETKASTVLDGRALALDERAVCLAMAISIDFDYFSRKGGGGIMPMFFPGYYGGGSDSAAEAVEGAEPGEIAPESEAGGQTTEPTRSDWGNDGESSFGDDNDPWGKQTEQDDNPWDDDDSGGGDGDGGSWWSDLGDALGD